MRIRTEIYGLDAHQYFYGKPFEDSIPIINCTGGGSGHFARPLVPVPEGLEVLGPSTNAVRHPDGHLIEVRQGDWVLVAPNGNLLVVSDLKLKAYLKFLGADETEPRA